MKSLSPKVDSVLDEIRRFPLVFLHAGELFAPDALEKELLSRLGEMSSEVARAEVTELGSAREASFTLVVGMDRLVGDPKRCEILANTRAEVMLRLERGERLILFSKTPKSTLLGCTGSQVVTDARSVFVAPMILDDVREALGDIETADVQNIFNYSAGFPTLISKLVEVHELDLDRKQRLLMASGEVRRALTEAVRQLGWEAVSFLESSWPDAGPVSDEHVPALIGEALRGGGIATVAADGSSRLQVRPPGTTRLAEEAIREAADSLVEPPDEVKVIAAGLWEIERRTRRTLQLAFMNRHGTNWRSQALSKEAQSKVQERFGSEALESIADVEKVPNPLEWLTLDEVILMLENLGWARSDEFPPVFWRRMRSDLVPIRNRLAHFRLPQRSDAEQVRRWLVELQRRGQLDGE